MNIAIIGTGNVGGTLAKRFAEVGHRIFLGTRNPQDEKIKQLVSSAITAHTVTDAVQSTEVIILATPGNLGTEVAKELGDLSGKLVIDATNAVFSKPQGYNTTADAVIALCNTKEVVKCSNTTGFANMENPDFNGTKIDMFVAGSGRKAKDIAIQLAKEIGFGEVYNLGGDEQFQLIEQLALIWISLARSLGRDIAFKILKRIPL